MQCDVRAISHLSGNISGFLSQRSPPNRTEYSEDKARQPSPFVPSLLYFIRKTLTKCKTPNMLFLKKERFFFFETPYFIRLVKKHNKEYDICICVGKLELWESDEVLRVMALICVLNFWS